MTSALVEIDFSRVLYRTDLSLLAAVPGILVRLARYEIDEVVLGAAAAFPDPNLRSLDAIHLATARTIFGRTITAFVSYDERRGDGPGLPAISPGRSVR